MLGAMPDDATVAKLETNKAYRLPDGRSLVVIESGAGEAPAAAEDGVGVSSAALSTTVMPIFDTWVRRIYSDFDFGRSCELRVGKPSTLETDVALLRFAIPTTVTCSTISSARLVLTTAQQPSGSTALVSASKVTSSWIPGSTGLATCNQCTVTSGAQNPFAMPNTAPPVTTVAVNAPCRQFSWDITSLVALGGWCAVPATNFGVMMSPHPASPSTAVASFHSNEAPSGQRPRLLIVY